MGQSSRQAWYRLRIATAEIDLAVYRNPQIANPSVSAKKVKPFGLTPEKISGDNCKKHATPHLATEDNWHNKRYFRNVPGNKNKFGGHKMKPSSVARLVLFTIAVLTGTGLILTGRLFLVGLLLVCFSNVILMDKREREDQTKKWTTPLTRWQIFQGFIPLFVMLGVLGYFLATDSNVPNSTPEQDAVETGWKIGLIWTWTFRAVFLICVVFVIGQPWMRWYKLKNSNE